MVDFYLESVGERPDFRLVLCFLWGDKHDADTDGNAKGPTCRRWTELWCRERVAPEDEFEVEPVSLEPLVLRVTATRPEISARVAFFLARETGCASVHIGSLNEPVLQASDFPGLVGEFSLDAALSRVQKSPFRRATPQSPYPPE